MTPEDLRMLAAKMAGKDADGPDSAATEQRLRDSFAQLGMELTRQRSGLSLKGVDGKGMSGLTLTDAAGILASLNEAIADQEPE